MTNTADVGTALWSILVAIAAGIGVLWALRTPRAPRAAPDERGAVNAVCWAFSALALSVLPFLWAASQAGTEAGQGAITMVGMVVGAPVMLGLLYAATETFQAWRDWRVQALWSLGIGGAALVLVAEALHWPSVQVAISLTWMVALLAVTVPGLLANRGSR